MRDFAIQSRAKLKRSLLDKLDELHKFTPPPTLVMQEFEAVWSQVKRRSRFPNRTFADEGTTEEKAREDYQQIADRRVRLGLVLAESDRNDIKVADEDLTRAVVERARHFRGRNSRCGTTTARSRRRWRSFAHRFTRKRWWTSSPNSPALPTRRSPRKNCSKPEDAAEGSLMPRWNRVPNWRSLGQLADGGRRPRPGFDPPLFPRDVRTYLRLCAGPR